MTFRHMLRAEWTKLRSVRRWVLGLLLALVITTLFSVVGASGNSTDANDHPELLPPTGPDGQQVHDSLHFVHQQMAGDGTITARVASQENSHERAMAGIMVKESVEPGSPYAAVLVTPGHGVRFHTNFTTDLAGSGGSAPHWLRLTRTGDTVTGYESGDGRSWTRVGAVELAGLPATAEVGMFVNSPDQIEVDRSFAATSVGGSSTEGTATFDNVQLEPATAGAWQDIDLTAPPQDQPGGSTEQDGIFTITGTGDLAPRPLDADVTQLSLFGVFAGQIAVVAIAVLFITAEFKRGMIRTTFAASPHRGRVLAAKALVIGVVTFVVGLVGCVLGFLGAQPILRASGFEPPGYPVQSLTDWPVFRAVAGAAAFLALIAVLAVAVGAILRRSAAAIAGLIVLLILPFILQGGLPLTAAQWLLRVTPTAGLAMTQSIQPSGWVAATDPFAVASPLGGLAVLTAYATGALAIAYWRLRRWGA